MMGKVPLFHETAKMVFQSVAAGTGDVNHIPDGDAAMLARMIENLNGQLGQRGDHQFFPLHLGGQAALLLLQGAGRM
jgi:hypothetical protein